MLIDSVWFESPSHAIFEDGHQLIMIVGTEVDAVTVSEAAVQPVVYVGEQAFFIVGDEYHRQVGDAVKVVQEDLVFELTYFVEDDDVRWAVVVAEPVGKDVSWELIGGGC